MEWIRDGRFVTCNPARPERVATAPFLAWSYLTNGIPADACAAGPGLETLTSFTASSASRL